MNKLYYDNPIKAAYMAREFSVRFVDTNGIEVFLTPFIDIEDIRPKFIHPDSLDIFEPKEGDLLTGKNGKAVMFFDDRHESNDRQIILCDNKHFFMPKEE